MKKTSKFLFLTSAIFALGACSFSFDFSNFISSSLTSNNDSSNESTSVIDNTSTFTSNGDSSDTSSNENTSTSQGNSSNIEVVYVEDFSFDVAPENKVEIYVDQYLDVTCEAYPFNASNKNFTLSIESGGENYCSVSLTTENKFKIKGINEGQCDLCITSCDSNRYSETLTIYVVKVAPSNISLNVTDLTIEVGETFELIPSFEGNPYADKSVIWVTSAVRKVSVANGVVKGISIGDATITCRSALDSHIYDKCYVHVVEAILRDLTINLPSGGIFYNNVYSINVSPVPSKAVVNNVDWSIQTNPQGIATIDQNGTLSAYNEGEVTLTASTVSYGLTVEKSITFNIQEKLPSNITSTTLDVSLMKNKSKQLKWEVLPSNTSNKNVIFKSNDENIVTVDSDGLLTSKETGTTQVFIISERDDSINLSINVEVTEEQQFVSTHLNYTYQDLNDNSIYGSGTDNTPTKGNVKMLVIPVWFPESEQAINISKKTKLRDDIAKAYGGSSSDTGWESVKSFYKKESNNTLNLTCVTTDWYEPGDSIGNYVSSTSNTQNLVIKATNWYKNTSGLSNFTDFDSDNDGYLDGVVLIYAFPDYSAIQTSQDYSNLWAYCYYVGDSNQNNKYNPGPNTFFWASYDFLYDNDDGMSNYNSGDTRTSVNGVILDTHTYIHETGHMLGLPDYYDYSSNGYSPAGGFSMQDYNVGSHDPFSIMSLGWVDPMIVDSTMTVKIEPFQSSRDLILVSPTNVKSVFDEYFLIELYTPTGLNKLDSETRYDRAYPQGPSVPGIRIWHVDSRIIKLYYNMTWDFVESPYLTAYDKQNCYGCDTAFTNSSYARSGDEDRLGFTGVDYADYNILTLIRNNVNTGIHTRSTLTSDDLFKTGDIFTISKYSKQFVNAGKMNKLNNLKQPYDFEYSINFINVSESEATIEFAII